MSTSDDFGANKPRRTGSRSDNAAMGPASLMITDMEVARRFQSRAVELARQGIFGSLRTRKSSLQSAYSLLLSMIDVTYLPFLIYGEEGAGKRRHVDEYLIIQNFYNKLLSRTQGALKVFRGDFVSPGFTAQFRLPHTSASDIVYLEEIDRMDLACQGELLEYIKNQKKVGILDPSHLNGPRLIAGTSRALSVMVLKNEFMRELFQVLTSFALFLPTLNERSEDLPQLIQAFVLEESGKLKTPPVWLVDRLSQKMLPGNLDELRKILAKGLRERANFSDWTQDFFSQLTGEASSSTFVRVEASDYTQHLIERKRLKQALIKSGGDREVAATVLSMNRVEFLQRLVAHGLR